ncbi:MAG: ABC transporter permease [Coprobacillaceae bacterium]
MQAYAIFWRMLKWRFQNPATIIMNIIQPIVWLLLYSTLFQSMYEGMNYTTFLVPGLLVLTVLTSAGISTGISNYYTKSGGSFYRIYISPTKRSSIVLGQILEVEILSFIGIGILILLSLCLSVTIASGIFGLILIMIILFLCVFFVGNISYCLSFILPDENAFIGLVNMLVLPLFFVSSAFMPIEQLPSLFQNIAKYNPFSYSIDCIRELILYSSINWSSIIFVCFLFSILGGLSFIGAVLKLKNEKEK